MISFVSIYKCAGASHTNCSTARIRKSGTRVASSFEVCPQTKVLVPRDFFRLMTLLGLLVFGLGFSYCHLLLHLYGGSTLTVGTGPDLLRAQV